MIEKKRRIVAYPVVKIQLPTGDSTAGAVIYSEDGTINTPAALSLAKKRLRPGQSFGYFKAELDEDGVLEIGDRVADPTVPW